MKTVKASKINHFNDFKKLLYAYYNFLNINLDFQDFKKELSSIPGKYGTPDGCLLLGYDNDIVVGCVAIRKLEKNICEMKRLYIKDEYHGCGYGMILVDRIIHESKLIGYQYMRLDTIDKLSSAINLYKKIGFKTIPPYYDTPLPDTTFWELDLNKYACAI